MPNLSYETLSVFLRVTIDKLVILRPWILEISVGTQFLLS